MNNEYKSFQRRVKHNPVWVKIHDVPLQGRSSFARCLIEVKADEALKDNIAIVVNKRESCKPCSTNTNRSGINVGKTAWRPVKPKVIFEPKAHGNSPKNEATNVSTSVKDGLNIVHTSSKEQPTKDVDIPSSSYTSVIAKKGCLKAPTSSSNIPTSKPYDLLS
nr:hypothetical protein [Tanacetum cinerariifolium]